MEAIIRRTLLLLLCSSIAAGQLAARDSLETLLKGYRSDADLSAKTKRESAGFIEIYTRDDLERMQIYHLRDILKSARFLQYDLNSFGMVDPLQMNPLLYSSDLIKIFVDDYEITSGYIGSGLQFYGNIDMGMFDHVEIYTGTPVLDVSTEPAAIVIKLYTKVPERENGAGLTLRAGDRGSKVGSLFSGTQYERWSYYAYVQGAGERFAHEKNRGFDISKDYRQNHAFFKIAKRKESLQAEYLWQRHDPFAGASMQVDPTGGSWRSKMFRLSGSTTLFDDFLQADLSYIRSGLDIASSSVSPLWFQVALPQTIEPDSNRIGFNLDGDLLTLKARHSGVVGDHQLTAGGEYRYKNGDFKSFEINGRPSPMGSARFDIAGLFLEDHYRLTAASMATVSFKYNFYDFRRRQNGTSAAQHLNTWQGRLGYSRIDGPWSFKSFLIHTEVPPQLYMLIIQQMPMERYTFDTLSAEISRRSGPSDWKYLLMLSRADNAEGSILDQGAGANIQKNDVYIVNTSFDYRYRFDRFSRIDFDIFWSHANKSYYNFGKNYVGSSLRLLNNFGRLDLFNEVIFRQGRGEIENGFDYTFGIKYQLSRDMRLAFKGENLFNGAKKSAYVTLDPFAANPKPGSVELPVLDRKLYLTLEWLF